MLLWRSIILYKYHKLTWWKKYKIRTSIKIEKYELQSWGTVCLRLLVKINWKGRPVHLFRFTSSSNFFPKQNTAESRVWWLYADFKCCLTDTSTDVPQLTMWLPDKPIVSWKYPKSKMHLMHLTHWTSQLSLACLKCT